MSKPEDTSPATEPASRGGGEHRRVEPGSVAVAPDLDAIETMEAMQAQEAVEADAPWTPIELEALRAFEAPATRAGDAEAALGTRAFADTLIARLEQEAQLATAPERREAGSGGKRRLSATLAGLSTIAALALAFAAVWWLRAQSQHSQRQGVVAGPPLSVQAEHKVRAPLPTDLSKDVKAWVAQFGRRYGAAFRFSGVVVVARGDHELVLGFGRMGVNRGGLPGADTLFRVGALTQPMVAVAAERMAQRGLVDFERPVREYIPELPAAWGMVRVDDLITHASGIPSFTDTLAWTFGRGEVHLAADLWAYVANEPLHFAPGSDFEASNTNFVLLGEVLARQAKTSIDQVLRDEVFVPAGMPHAHLGMGSPPRSAQGMSFDEDEILIEAARVAPSAYGAAGGVVASARDLVAFHHALEDERLVSARTQREMYKGNGQYARGWASRWVDGDFEVSHPGGLDGFNANITRHLADGTLVIVMANTDAVDARPVAQGVMQLALGQRPTPPVERVEHPVTGLPLQDFVGEYELSAATRARLVKQLGTKEPLEFEKVSIEQRASTLWMQVPGHGRKWLHSHGEDRFFFKDRAGTLATFERGESGVRRLILEVGKARFDLVRRSGQ